MGKNNCSTLMAVVTTNQSDPAAQDQLSAPNASIESATQKQIDMKANQIIFQQLNREYEKQRKEWNVKCDYKEISAAGRAIILDNQKLLLNGQSLEQVLKKKNIQGKVGAILIGSNAFMLSLKEEELNDDLSTIISEFKLILIQLRSSEKVLDHCTLMQDDINHLRFFIEQHYTRNAKVPFETR